ncbi:MAG: tetratricopeptide repeat protein [Alphaproteobacteria bacterium]|nr:tetratricopeptide repeat protein [Alphaproteobacteria bacterium]
MFRATSLSFMPAFIAATAARFTNPRAMRRRSINFAKRLRVLLWMSIGIAILSAPALAEDKAWEDCQQDTDRDRSIRGCKRFLARGDAESASKRAAANYIRGGAYVRIANYDYAITDFDEAIRLDPKHADGYIGRALAYSRKSNYDRAIVDLDEATRLDLKSANHIVHFDRVLHVFSEIASERDHDEEIRRNPTQFAIYIFRGLAYLKKKNFNYAIADFSEAILRNSKLVLAYFFRASAHLGNGDPIQARADLEAALAIDPRNQLVKEWLLEVLPAKAPVVTPTPTIVSPSASAPAPQQLSTSHSCAGSRRVALVVGSRSSTLPA